MRKEEKKKTFWTKYRGIFGICICLFVITYIIVYLCFKGNGFLSAGIALEKKDWLSFLGAYLTFTGTVMVSLIATLQTKFFEEREKEQELSKRQKVLQPIFSIDIVEINKQISGTAEMINPYDSSTFPIHKNVTYAIENVSEYPIQNVIIFDKYFYQLLRPNDKKNVSSCVFRFAGYC